MSTHSVLVLNIGVLQSLGLGQRLPRQPTTQQEGFYFNRTLQAPGDPTRISHLHDKNLCDPLR